MRRKKLLLRCSPKTVCKSYLKQRNDAVAIVVAASFLSFYRVKQAVLLVLAMYFLNRAAMRRQAGENAKKTDYTGVYPFWGLQKAMCVL